jgi:uncharacterized membrane protein YoaK (UPF0700 family)
MGLSGLPVLRKAVATGLVRHHLAIPSCQGQCKPARSQGLSGFCKSMPTPQAFMPRQPAASTMDNREYRPYAIRVTLQKWLMVGGCGLAFGAAFANTGLVLHTGTAVSHLTGDISNFTINLARWSPVAKAGLLAASTAAAGFLLGAMLAGFAIHHPSLDFSRPYGRSITAIGTLFLTASLLVERWPLAGISLAACACGMQNALATHYRGLILRTTHLTGMFTDLGISLGMKIRGHDVALWKIAVPAALIASFCAGALAAALLETAGFDAIRCAGIGYASAGISWSILKHVFHRVPGANS